MKITAWCIDTFTTTAFKGNPSWVCLIEEQPGHDVMQSIANELNCPVTAFIKKHPGTLHQYDIWYFTPITEIPACGHGTLASAKFASEQQGAGDSFIFHTIENVSIQTVVDNQGSIIMTFPAYQLEHQVVSGSMLSALGLDGYTSAGYAPDLETLFIELDKAEALRNLEPDYHKMVRSDDKIKEVVITSVSDHPEYDYYLRSFCPWIGIDEDPVTGSVHGVLGNFWKKKLNKAKMIARQASLRGGDLLITAFDNRVEIGGTARILLKGEMDF